jgi:iron complex transport system substrate-binding protein
MPQPRVACLEWLDPPFNAGHWTPELVELAGGLSVTGERGKSSRMMTWQEIINAQPDVLFIACCGYSIERTLEDLPILMSHPKLHTMPFWKNQQIYVADGNHYFNRPGPRLIDSLEMLADAVYPEQNLLLPGQPAAVRIDITRITSQMVNAS